MVYYINICGHIGDAGGSGDAGSHACVASDHVDETAAVCQTLREPGGSDDNGQLPLGLGLADSGKFRLIDDSDYSVRGGSGQPGSVPGLCGWPQAVL